MRRADVVRFVRRWHNRLLWPGGVALVIWAISGITHPLMSWSGPEAETRRPPELSFDVSAWQDNLAAAQESFDYQLGGGALMVVPSARGPILRAQSASEVRYFQNGELQRYSDRDQAIWLAQHYLGQQRASTERLAGAELVAEFSERYPEVNRLLPVWRVSFNDTNGLHVYVHTQTSSLAIIGDANRVLMQRIFQWLHTHSYLSAWPWLQLLVAAFLMTSLFAFALSGAVLIFAMPKRPFIQQTTRRWHRRTALIAYIPLIALSGSGLYHLWFSYFDQREYGQHVVSTRPVSQGEFSELTEGLAEYEGLQVQQISLVTTPDGPSFIRLQHVRESAAETREQRFAGHAAYLDVTYVGVEQSGSQSTLVTDESVAYAYARRIRPDSPQQVEQITRFGGLYDFRNKRLPVWQFTYDDETLFIDPGHQMLVERISVPAKWERWSFSNFHKWNFFTPVIGRSNRDILVVAVLLVFLTMTVFGLRMALQRRK